MTITPGTPDDWTDTVEPKRAEAFVEYFSRDIGYNLRHYASPHASHRMGGGCQCRPSRIPHVGLAAPESARPATLTVEQPVKAPGQDGDIFLPRGTVVEADWPNGNRSTVYVDEGGYQHIAGWVGNVHPLPWGDGRIVRVLTEDKPTQEPVLPRRIEPEDVRVGMVVEQRKGESLLRGRVIAIEGGTIECEVAWLHTEDERDGWSLWLVEDAPAPVDPDAEAVERMAKEVHDRNCADGGCRDWDGHGESTRKAWRDDARVVIRNLRAQGFDVTARAEQ